MLSQHEHPVFWILTLKGQNCKKPSPPWSGTVICDLLTPHLYHNTTHQMLLEVTQFSLKTRGDHASTVTPTIGKTLLHNVSLYSDYVCLFNHLFMFVFSFVFVLIHIWPFPITVLVNFKVDVSRTFPDLYFYSGALLEYLCMIYSYKPFFILSWMFMLPLSLASVWNRLF